MGEHILVVGATLLDLKGQPFAGLEPHTSNPARIRTARGGSARNVAENLALLGADVILLTAVGRDIIGQSLLVQTGRTGINLDYALTVDNASTGVYFAIMEEDGALSVALDDVNVMTHISPGYLNRHRRLFRDASMVMVDGSLTPDAIKTVVRLTEHYNVPLIADPSSSRLAYKLRPYLSNLHLVVPNEVEIVEMCRDFDLDGDDQEGRLAVARSLVQAGVENVVVTRSDFGLDYATAMETGSIPPSHSQFVDGTGTGDAVTAAIMFGMDNEIPTVEAIRLGAAAASLTLQTYETVVPNLNLDMLFEHLIV